MDGLAAGAFDEVVLGAHDDQPPGARIMAPGDFDHVGADDILGIGQGLALQQAHEGFVGIGCLVAGGDLVEGRGLRVAGLKIERCQDAAIDRD